MNTAITDTRIKNSACLPIYETKAWRIVRQPRKGAVMLDFFAISAVGKALQSASNLVRELKRPRVSRQDFSAILRHEMQQQRVGTQHSAELKQASDITETFMKQRDADGNGRISLAESGWDAKAFEAADLNGDGELSPQELETYLLKQIQTNRAQATNHG